MIVGAIPISGIVISVYRVGSEGRLKVDPVQNTHEAEI